MDIVLDTQAKLNLSADMKGSVVKSRQSHNKVFGDYTEYTLLYKGAKFEAKTEFEAREALAKNEFYAPSIAEGRLTFLPNGHILFVEKSHQEIYNLVSLALDETTKTALLNRIRQEKSVKVYPETEVKVQLWALGSRIGEPKNTTKVFANYFKAE